MPLSKSDITINDYPLSREDHLHLVETLIDLELVKEWPVAQATEKNRVVINLQKLEEITGQNFDLNLVTSIIESYEEVGWRVKYFPPPASAIDTLIFS